MVKRLLLPMIGLVLAAAACSGDAATDAFPEGSFSVVASGDLSVGADRILVGVSLPDNTRLGSPDDAVTLSVAPDGDPDRAQVVDGTFIWILEPVVGLYKADVEFDRAGIWSVTVTPDGGSPLEPSLFNVFETSFAPRVGEVAPLPPTPTLADSTIEELTTDTEPDSRFYETSLADAVASGSPTVLVFSTPAYCQTSACGPLLDIVKDAAPSYPEVNFVHVEVFTGLTEPDFVPDSAHLAPSVGPDWYNLPTEPWVFVIDSGGIISARFEGAMAATELEEALRKISL